MGNSDVGTYEIKFYASEGTFKSDWPVYSYKKTYTYIQAEQEAKKEMKSHPNWYTYKIEKNNKGQLLWKLKNY